MITPLEIKKQALKWWKPLLQSHIAGEAFFPKTVERIGKVKSGQVTARFKPLQEEIETLYRHSKQETGLGYAVKTTNYNFRRTGAHDLPDEIIFETTEDYLSFIGKKKEWKTFLSNYAIIITAIPGLKKWTIDNCLWLTEFQIPWQDVMKVCRYFLSAPRPNLYLRQLPVAVHTKFIEENALLIQSLLDFLIPEHIRNATQRRFAERYFLRYDEPLVRIRILDQAHYYAGKLSDISIPLSDFANAEWQAASVIITENKMNFLTLPAIASTIAVWSGGGFHISYLRDVKCLCRKKIFYWGDIDEHGFQILHQLRHYYPRAQSVMMDRKTFDRFHIYAGIGARNKSENLHLLTKEESELYQFLKSSNEKNRLEQEKIPQEYVDAVLLGELTESKQV